MRGGEMQALNYLRRAVPGCCQSLPDLACFTPKYAMKAHDRCEHAAARIKALRRQHLSAVWIV